MCLFGHTVDHSRICLPGTELLQSPFRTEFSMGSRSWRYRQSLRHHRRFLRSYRDPCGIVAITASLLRSLQSCRDPCGIVLIPEAIARLAKHKTLLNILKHYETCKTLWYIVKHCEPLVKHHETLLKHCETSKNTQTLMIRCDDIGALCGDVCVWRGDVGDRGDQYGISFLGLNVHFDIFSSRNGPSVTVRWIFEFVHLPISLNGVSNVCNLNGISCAPCEYRVSTYSL